MKSVLSLVLLVTFSFSQSQISKINNGKCKTKNYLTEIEYEWVNNKIIIPVKINGQIYRFLFDTGAPNLISKEILNQVPHKKLKSIKVNDINKGREKMEFITIKQLFLGDAELVNTTSLVVEKANNIIFQCFEIDGIIGSNLLRTMIVKMDANEKKLIFTDDINRINNSPETASQNLYKKDNQSGPYFEIKLLGDNGKVGTEKLLFDSGMGDLFDLAIQNFKVYQKDTLFHHFEDASGSSSVGLFAGNSKQKEYRVTIPELRLGNAKLSNLTTITTITDHSRIGAKLLDYANITLDYINQKIYFEWYKKNEDLKESLLGFSPTLFNGKLAIGSVWDKNLVDQIEYGDIILNFNEYDLKSIELCELITKKSIFNNPEKAHLKVQKKNGSIVEVDLQKYFLK